MHYLIVHAHVNNGISTQLCLRKQIYVKIICKLLFTLIQIQLIVFYMRRGITKHDAEGTGLTKGWKSILFCMAIVGDALQIHEMQLLTFCLQDGLSHHSRRPATLNVKAGLQWKMKPPGPKFCPQRSQVAPICSSKGAASIWGLSILIKDGMWMQRLDKAIHPRPWRQRGSRGNGHNLAVPLKP